MVARINTVAFQGIDVTEVNVQATIASGIPGFHVVGLPDKAVAESRERVRAAIQATGVSLPAKRITVNLAPADVQKEGSHFDLPIALALLVAMGILPSDELQNYLVLGELALDGEILPVAGVLPTAIAASAKNFGVICPESCGGEAAWAGDCDILAPHYLHELINHFKGEMLLSVPKPEIAEHQTDFLDLAEIKGQETAKRVLEIAAAGGHNMLLSGPPGSGKSMLAARLSGILPPMDPREALETTMIYSVSGMLDQGKLLKSRPYRAPHHSSSLPALVGGGIKAKPGEISLAHNGVLFLDELPEFNRATLESLRQPIESGKAHIARANSHVIYPSKVLLVAAMNPCKCGFLGDAEQACSRAPRCGLDYQSKISGPLIDRIDLYVEVSPVPSSSLGLAEHRESSVDIAKRVHVAREIQKQRYKDVKTSSLIRTNAEADGKILASVTQLDTDTNAFLNSAADKLRLSARGYHRVLRVARTIADLDASNVVQRVHVAEALSYRFKKIR